LTWYLKLTYAHSDSAYNFFRYISTASFLRRSLFFSFSIPNHQYKKMATEPAPQKHTIPPPWYSLQTSPKGHPYIALPSRPRRPAVFLTAFYSTDAAAVQSILSNPSINNSLISVPQPYTLSDAEWWISLQLTGTSCLALQALRADDPDSGPFIGAVSLTPVTVADDPEARLGQYELGYYLSTEFQRRGIVRDAVLAAIAWANAEGKLTEVVVKVAEGNVGSRSLVESLEGFELSGEMTEVKWPESKGGGVQKLAIWRREFAK
jgi:[ribosomal protein S5]-alanine N-acetyltransferase